MTRHNTDDLRTAAELWVETHDTGEVLETYEFGGLSYCAQRYNVDDNTFMWEVVSVLYESQKDAAYRTIVWNRTPWATPGQRATKTYATVEDARVNLREAHRNGVHAHLLSDEDTCDCSIPRRA